MLFFFSDTLIAQCNFQRSWFLQIALQREWTVHEKKFSFLDFPLFLQLSLSNVANTYEVSLFPIYSDGKGTFLSFRREHKGLTP